MLANLAHSLFLIVNVPCDAGLCKATRLCPCHPSSVVFRAQHQHGNCFLFDQLMSTNRLYARTVCIIDRSWLAEVEGKGYQQVSVFDVNKAMTTKYIQSYSRLTLKKPRLTIIALFFHQ